MPDRVTEFFKLKVVEPPKLTSPPPERFVPAETVILALVRAELGIFFKVLSEPEIVLLVKV